MVEALILSALEFIMKITSFVPPVDPVFTIELTRREALVLRMVVSDESGVSALKKNTGIVGVPELTSGEAGDILSRLYIGLHAELSSGDMK